MAKIFPSKPAMILLYGFPGAGKTYFARQFCDSVQAAHVHGDRIRAELFESPRHDKQENAVITQLMDYMSEEFLNAGISVVYDMNAMRARQRLDMREMARRCHATPIVVWFQIDTESAFNRAVKRDRRRADDKYAADMDRANFNDIITHMQNPVNTEEYIVVSGKHTFGTQFTAVGRRMRELGLIGLGEDTGRAVKPGLVNLVPNPHAGRVDLARRNIIVR